MSNLEEKILAWRQESTGSKKNKNNPKFTEEELQQLIDELMLNRVKVGELVQIEKELNKTVSQYSTLCNFYPSGYLLMDADGIIREVNKALEEMLGVEKSHLLDVGLMLFVDDDSRDQFNDFLIKLIQSRSKQESDIVLKRSSGETFAVTLYGKVDENMNGSNCICRLTITEKKQSPVKDIKQVNQADLTRITEDYIRTRIYSKLAEIVT